MQSLTDNLETQINTAICNSSQTGQHLQKTAYDGGYKQGRADGASETRATLLQEMPAHDAALAAAARDAMLPAIISIAAVAFVFGLLMASMFRFFSVKKSSATAA